MISYYNCPEHLQLLPIWLILLCLKHFSKLPDSSANVLPPVVLSFLLLAAIAQARTSSVSSAGFISVIYLGDLRVKGASYEI